MTYLSARVRFALLVVAAVAVSATTSMIRGDQFLEGKVRVLEGRAEARVVEAVIEAKADVIADPAVAEKPDGGEEDVEAQFPSGAGLKTDPELEGLLKRAELFVSDGRYDLATILWQRVLDESGQTVMTRPEWTFKSFESRYRKYQALAEEIERTIARLPEEGLRQYRLSADGDAKAMLADGAGAGREAALGNVVQRYFISSLGDDAAFELACLRLDRYDFIGASRLLSRILTDYPDPSVDRSEVQLRLALANARVGDLESAKNALDTLDEGQGGVSLARLGALVRGEVAQGLGSGDVVDAGDSWAMNFGGPERIGHMRGLPPAVTADTLSESWFEDFEINGSADGGVPQANNSGVFFGKRALISRSSYVEQPQQGGSASRESLLGRWKGNGWMPTGQVLLHNGMVIYKRPDRVVARDAATGELKWMTRPSTYMGPALTQWLVQMRRNYGMQMPQDAKPSTQLESVLFGDRLHQAMLICDGMFYTIDGSLVDAPVAQPTNNQNQGFNFQNVPRRTRTNFLSAYDATNGKFKWIRSPDGSETGGKFDLGFMAAPVPYAKFLLAPVSDSGAIWLYALEKANGNLVWKTFLCEDPIGGANPWSSVGVAVGGGDAYVATGGGVIFAVDAMSGHVRWAVRYQRSGKENTNLARFGIAAQSLMDVSGFEDDLVIPHGRALIVLASDANKIFALDRRSGELLWESPRQPLGEDDPALYCLGVLGDGMFVAGKKSLRRYDLSKDGKMVWEARFDASFGHGVLTADAIYVPVGDTVAKYDPATGKLQSQVGMFTATNEPVGNLFSDGARLLAVGLGRAYALQDLESRIALLAERIKTGDSDAQLQRMRLRLRGNKQDEALADLRDACKLILAQQGAAPASRTLYGGIGELALVDRDPRLALSLVVEAQPNIDAAQSAAKITPEEMQQVHSQRDNVLFQAFRIIKKETKPSTAEILAASAIIDKPNLVNAARQALMATSGTSDAELLRAAVGSENARTRVVAVAALPKALGEDAPTLLATLLDDKNDEVKLTAATALADRGDRRALNTFGKLLDSEDLQVRSRSVAALRAMTGQKFKYLAYEKADERIAGAEEWRRWISTSGETAELKFPIGDSQVMLGRTLVAYYSQGKVVEYDADRNKVWELNGVNQPWGADGLPNGHRLICSYNGQFVAEYDENGKEVWRKDGLPGYASHAHRLDDGNTLVACSNVNKVIEIAPDGKVVWEKEINGYPQDARRLDNGNTLIALQTTNRVVEIDRDGNVIWEANENMQGPFAARRLDNGNTLVALSGAGQVVELDQDKKVVWRQQGLQSPYDAQRLDNGNTLIVDTRGMREVDAEGKTVWEHNEGGALRIHRY